MFLQEREEAKPLIESISKTFSELRQQLPDLLETALTKLGGKLNPELKQLMEERLKTLKPVDILSDEESDEKIHDALGFYHSETQQIGIKASYVKERSKQYHECIHELLHAASMGQTKDRLGGSTILEDGLTEFFTVLILTQKPDILEEIGESSYSLPTLNILLLTKALPIQDILECYMKRDTEGLEREVNRRLGEGVFERIFLKDKPLEYLAERPQMAPTIELLNALKASKQATDEIFADAETKYKIIVPEWMKERIGEGLVETGSLDRIPGVLNKKEEVSSNLPHFTNVLDGLIPEITNDLKDSDIKELLAYLHLKFDLNSEEGVERLRERYQNMTAGFGEENVRKAFIRYPQATAVFMTDPRDIKLGGFRDGVNQLEKILLPDHSTLEQRIKWRLIYAHALDYGSNHWLSKKICGSCGRENEADYNFCPYGGCGSIKELPTVRDNALHLIGNLNTLLDNLTSVVPNIKEADPFDLANTLVYLHSAFNLETKEGMEKFRERYEKLASEYGDNAVAERFQREPTNFSRFMVNPENIEGRERKRIQQILTASR